MTVTLHFPTLPDLPIPLDLMADGRSIACLHLDYTNEHGATEKATHITDEHGARRPIPAPLGTIRIDA